MQNSLTNKTRVTKVIERDILQNLFINAHFSPAAKKEKTMIRHQYNILQHIIEKNK